MVKKMGLMFLMIFLIGIPFILASQDISSQDYQSCISERDQFQINYSLCAQNSSNQEAVIEYLNKSLIESIDDSEYYQNLYLSQEFNLTYQDFINLQNNFTKIETKVTQIKIAVYISLALLSITFISTVINLIWNRKRRHRTS